MLAAATQRRWRAAPADPTREGGGVRTYYRKHFQLRGDEFPPESAFPSTMPWYFRHTSRFPDLSYPRTLMRVRCGSTSLAGCPSNYSAHDTACPRCTTGAAETARHVFFECPSTAPLRADARYAQLFAGLPAAPRERLRAFMNAPNQNLLAEFVTTCDI